MSTQNAKLTSERDQAIRELAKLSRENAEKTYNQNRKKTKK